MCAALAPRAELGFGGTAAASTACGGMARRGMEPSAPAQKLARHRADGGRKVPAPAALRLLEERMETELAAVLALLRKAERLSRNTGKGAAVPVPAAGKETPRFLAAGPRPEEDPGKATRKRKTPPSKQPAPEAAAAQKSKEPEKPQDQRATGTPPPTRKTSMSHLLAEPEEARERRRWEEIARARDKFRQELLEVERAALPDETIHPRDLEELGIIGGREYAVTPTKRQAQRRHRQASDGAATSFAAVCPSHAP